MTSLHAGAASTGRRALPAVVWTAERDQLTRLAFFLTAAGTISSVASVLMQLSAGAAAIIVAIAATAGIPSVGILGYRVLRIVRLIRPSAAITEYLPKARLSADYRQLVGRESTVADVLRALDDPAGAAAVCITGFAGSGKTAIATEVMNALYERDDVGTLFVSAKRETLRDGFAYALDDPLLDRSELSRKLLKQWRDDQGVTMDEAIRLSRLKEFFTRQKCVVLLDNAETLKDYEDAVRTMIPLFGESRLLVTSRYPLAHLHGVYEFGIGGLDRRATFDLLRLEADRRNVSELNDADDDRLEPIYELTKGIPLLIHLVFGQIIRTRSIDACLGHPLAPSSQAPDPNALYEFLFADAWETLSEDAQRLLILIAQTPHPVSFAVLEPLFPPDSSGQLSRAINARTELIERALVEIVGPLEIRRQSHSVHPVTRSFIEHLHQKWQKQKESLVPSLA